MTDLYVVDYIGDTLGPVAPPPPATQAPRSVIERRIHSYLSEPIGSTIGQLGNISNQTAVIATSDQMALVAWEAASAFCRACYPVPGTGNRTIDAGASHASLRLDTFSVTSIEGTLTPVGVSPILWATRQSGVTVDGTTVSRLDAAVFESVYSRASPWGTIKHYCRDGKGDVLRFGPPASSDGHTITVEGYVLPGPLLAVESDIYGFSYVIPDDIVLSAVCAHAAYLLCEQQTDDVQLSARKGELIALVNEIRVREWARLSADRKAAHFGSTLALLQSAGAAPGKK